MSGDLEQDELAALLPGRPLRSYPALLSTEADAQAWARAGAPSGAVVVAGYQASPRGRGGLEWHPEPERSLAFSLVVRPEPALPAAREGWLYVAAVTALADLGGGEIEWPDTLPGAGAVGVHVELGPLRVDWAVVSVLLEPALPPRGPLLARAVEAIEARLAEPTAPVLADCLRRCATIGRRVEARLVPMGPGGVRVAGVARTILADGALVLEQDDGRRIAVRPQGLGVLEPLP